MARHKHKEKASGLTVLLIGTLAEGATLVLMSLLFSFFSYSMSDPLAITGLCSILSLVITAAVGGVVISRVKGDGGMAISVLSALLLCLILLLIGLIITGGELPLGCIISYLCYIAIAALSGFLGRKRNRRR
jgi:putative membrane protein (TIGR04086 family)